MAKIKKGVAYKAAMTKMADFSPVPMGMPIPKVPKAVKKPAAKVKGKKGK